MRLLVVVLVVLMVSSQASVSGGFSVCDNKIDFEKGEKPGGPFFGMGSGLSMFAYAEKYCGVSRYLMDKIFLDFIKKEGCSQNTEVYQQIQASIDWIEKASLADLLYDGAKNNLTEVEARKHAGKVVARFVNKERNLSGCGALEQFHTKLVKSGYGAKPDSK